MLLIGSPPRKGEKMIGFLASRGVALDHAQGNRILAATPFLIVLNVDVIAPGHATVNAFLET